MNEHILLEQLSRDDDRAYTVLYKLFYVPLLLFSRKYVHDEEAVKDLVQEVFVSMLGRKKDFENMIALKEYLYSSARNGCINYLRHEKVKGRFESYLLREGDEMDLFWDRVMEEDIYARLLWAVDHLPRQYRNVIRYTLEGDKISEIARKMDIALDTAKEYKKEGKRRLLFHLRSLCLLVPSLFSL
ncbi:MAG: sigma-70 family RNA polymerase sigma factor [Odoribacteraceae bacterium]|jgi:RNA polymerase sigma-70 factor (ECF subfamily)|nr:sigma-70 family RNA polymerase sigma factor [Odoribacteraceae bacterium]